MFLVLKDSRKVRGCFLPLTEFGITCPAQNTDPNVCEAEFKRFGAIGDGLVPLPHPHVSRAAVRPVQRGVWYQFDGFGKVGDGLVPAAQHVVSLAANVVVPSEGRQLRRATRATCERAGEFLQ